MNNDENYVLYKYLRRSPKGTVNPNYSLNMKESNFLEKLNNNFNCEQNKKNNKLLPVILPKHNLGSTEYELEQEEFKLNKNDTNYYTLNDFVNIINNMNNYSSILYFVNLLCMTMISKYQNKSIPNFPIYEPTVFLLSENEYMNLLIEIEALLEYYISILNLRNKISASDFIIYCQDKIAFHYTNIYDQFNHKSKNINNLSEEEIDLVLDDLGDLFEQNFKKINIDYAVSIESKKNMINHFITISLNARKRNKKNYLTDNLKSLDVILEIIFGFNEFIIHSKFRDEFVENIYKKVFYKNYECGQKVEVDLNKIEISSPYRKSKKPVLSLLTRSPRYNRSPPRNYPSS